jgi:hypothetical protein
LRDFSGRGHRNKEGKAAASLNAIAIPFRFMAVFCAMQPLNSLQCSGDAQQESGALDEV